MSSRRPSIQLISTSDGGNLCDSMTIQNTFIPVNSHSPTCGPIRERDPLQMSQYPSQMCQYPLQMTQYPVEMTQYSNDKEDNHQIHPIHQSIPVLPTIYHSFEEKISPICHHKIAYLDNVADSTLAKSSNITEKVYMKPISHEVLNAFHSYETNNYPVIGIISDQIYPVIGMNSKRKRKLCDELHE